MDSKNEIAAVCNRLMETLIAKNANYGDSAFQFPTFAPDVSPEQALFVRLSDKINRMKVLLRGEADKVGESLNDTILDMCGYGILLLVERGRHGEDFTDGE